MMTGEPPQTFEVEALVRELNLPSPAVASTVGHVSQQGIGAMHDGRRSINNRDDLQRLADEICRNTEI